MRKLDIFLLLIIFVAIFVYKQNSHAQYKISNSAISSGSSSSKNDSYIITGTFGWPIIGTSSNTNFSLISEIVPIELSSFTATVDVKDGVILEWITLSETNNYGFYIERSIDKNNFEEIGFVKGIGNSLIENIYSFIDTDTPEAGTLYYRLRQVDYDGSYEYSDILEVEVSSPREFKLEQNYPNPFNPVTTIRYKLPKSSNVVIKIYNVQGQEIKTLLNENQPAGFHYVKWNGTNNFGINVNSGIYIYRLQADKYISTKKMVFLK